MDRKPDTGERWKTRRSWTRLSLLWLAANVEYVLLMGEDSGLNREMATAMLAAFVAVLTGYLGITVMNDIKGRRAFDDGTPLPPPGPAPYHGDGR